jgi:hypothetical protein
MCSAKPDFDAALVGCKSFTHFLNLAMENGYIEKGQDYTLKTSVTPNMTATDAQSDFLNLATENDFIEKGQNRRLKIRTTPNITATDAHSEENIINPPVAMISAKEAQKEAKIYKKLLSEALKIPFPTLQERRDILKSIYKVLNQEFEMEITLREALGHNASHADRTLTLNEDPEPTLNLNEIADMVYEYMQEKSLKTNRNVIYKIVLGLHFAKCFYEQRGEASDLTSIDVVGVAKPYDVWEDELNRNYVSQIKNTLQSKVIQNAALATLLYESMDEEFLSKIQLLRS